MRAFPPCCICDLSVGQTLVRVGDAYSSPYLDGVCCVDPGALWPKRKLSFPDTVSAPVIFVGFRIIARVSEALPGRAILFPGFFGMFRDFPVFFGIFRDFSGFFENLQSISLFFGILRDFSARAAPAPVAGTQGPGHRPASESTARPGGAF